MYMERWRKGEKERLREVSWSEKRKKSDGERERETWIE
jgi:hypothetical protein